MRPQHSPVLPKGSVSFKLFHDFKINLFSELLLLKDKANELLLLFHRTFTRLALPFLNLLVSFWSFFLSMLAGNLLLVRANLICMHS